MMTRLGHIEKVVIEMISKFGNHQQDMPHSDSYRIERLDLLRFRNAIDAELTSPMCKFSPSDTMSESDVSALRHVDLVAMEIAAKLPEIPFLPSQTEPRYAIDPTDTVTLTLAEAEKLWTAQHQFDAGIQ